MDIKLTSNGIDFSRDFVLTESLIEKVAQRLSVRFKTHVNTWMLDLEYGVDWLGSVFGKGRSKAAVDALLTGEILKERYVNSITSFQSTLIGRVYILTFSVKVIDQGVQEVVTLSLLLDQNGLQITDENGNPLVVNT